MKIPLMLGASHFIHHGAVITLPDEKVELQIVPTKFAVGDIIVSVHNGDAGKQYKYNGNVIDITALCTYPAEVSITVSLCSRGHVLRVWQVEKLAVREIPGGFENVPQITALEERIKTLESAIADLTKLI